jgi:plastocyanin
MKQAHVVMLLMLSAFLLPVASANAATSLSTALKGRILIQTEAQGQAWYVEPQSGLRIYLGRPDSALMILKNFGLGMTTADIDRIAQIGFNDVDKTFAKKYAGRIILQVEDAGQAWYVNPVDLNKYYLGHPADVFSVMRGLGLGITNANLMKIPVDTNYRTDESAKNLNVTIKDNTFTPFSLEIKNGDTITWTNKGSFNHTVSTSNKTLPNFGSVVLSPGQSYSYTFNQSGIFDYNCSIHSSQIGRVIVR